MTGTSPNVVGKLVVDRVTVEYHTRKGTVHAVTDVSLDVPRGKTLALVGESGCGKSSLGRALLQLPRPTSGRVVVDETDLSSLSGGALKKARKMIQMVFQDPVSSLNPRRKVRDIVAEGLEIQGTEGGRQEIRRRVDAALEAVGLDPEHAGDRRPSEFSGGQCQRIALARALVLEPEVLVCDEPVSALDVSVQAQILNLLEEMKERYRLTMVFISHDLSVVHNIADQVAVMYLGVVCEVADTSALYRAPAHPYTMLLISSAPTLGGTLADTLGESPITATSSELPSPLDPPSGCRFRTRCPRATEICAAERPQLTVIAPGHQVACHHPLEENR
ncbi:oligopeptide/dipeptide ABC transporter ATP-binding protein [Dietzia sp. PP-33]|jgi:peptide/nickel transport system ATP-binding protein|uniref:ABC transporter ATP-binding protein n=1 Tax=Dietzia sp. PP-33 TaxID=2957500 RepID=UPI0029AA6DAC|nr:oligopeptide/dipeptide ABC transporter ATP-binding protein [Dietzia sp. PP-33]MDX2358464.1 ATP-binding cassette domain-containing protein [Dietzia sp. PP-33]